MMETQKNNKVTAQEVHDKSFAAARQGGYDAADVDAFLDRVIATLSSYESSFRRHSEIEQSFASIKAKADQQQMTIEKLRGELADMYSNGYANQAMMKRIQNLEERSAPGGAGGEERLKRIEDVLEQVLKELSRMAGLLR